MSFACKQKVLFKHCDPAGIVFYPRYFEMMNDCVEDFFSSELGFPFEQIHKKNGVPTAQIECTFSKPSYHGDRLVLTLWCMTLGGSSLTLNIKASCEEEKRFSSQLTIVYVGANGNPRAWPDSLRQAIKKHLVKE